MKDDEGTRMEAERIDNQREGAMPEREAEILTAIIEEYVQTAQPIASGHLALEQEWGLSAATIRTVMNRLEEAGDLHSPHTSAGRGPTDRAYRWYVTRSMEKRERLVPSRREREILGRRMGEEPVQPERVREVGQLLADLVHLAALSRLGGSTQIYGLAHIFRQPEYQLSERAERLAEVIDRVEELTRELPDRDDLQVYIGRETPLGKVADYSLVVRKFETPWGPALLGVMGPTRMPYPRVIGLLNYMNELIQPLSVSGGVRSPMVSSDGDRVGSRLEKEDGDGQKE